MIRSNKVRKNKSSNIFPRVLPKGTQPKEEKRRSEKKEKTNDWRCLKGGPYGMVWLHADRSRPVQSSRLEIYYTSYVLPTTKVKNNNWSSQEVGSGKKKRQTPAAQNVRLWQGMADRNQLKLVTKNFNVAVNRKHRKLMFHPWWYLTRCALSSVQSIYPVPVVNVSPCAHARRRR